MGQRWGVAPGGPTESPHRSMIAVASMMKRASPSARSALLGPREVDAKISVGHVCIGGCDIEQVRNQSGTLAPCTPGT